MKSHLIQKLSFTLFGLLTLSSYAGVSIVGAGSTFIEPIANKWFSDFHTGKRTDVQINYQGIGSGAGIKQLIAGTVDFAATDDPMKPQEEAALANGVLHIPVVVGAVAIVYNIDTKTPLKLDGETLGQIYLGTIKTWNDAHIAKLNPGVKLPELAITPMFRSDGSGTTGVFTDYLCKVNSQFKSVVGQGKAVTWPSGAGGKGNAGVAALVTQTPGAIGYVELTYALSNAMKFAEMKNADNVFILPTEHAAQAAAESVAAEMPANQYKMSITNLKGKHAYPISAFSWLLISKKWNAEKGGPMRELLSYVLSPTAQKAATSLHYAPLPQSLIRALDNEISKIDFGTKASEIAR